MIKYEEPEVVDPMTLKAGDQVACLDFSDRTVRMLLAGRGDPDEQGDVFWPELHNTPGETTHVGHEPVMNGNVALHFGGPRWKVAVLPRVWARRRIS